MEIETIYEDENLIVVNKPAGIIVFPENTKDKKEGNTLIDILISQNPELKKVGKPPRYGVVHRLDKDTSGILLIAKNNKSLIFLQNQFINRNVDKKYLALVAGNVEEEKGEIKTLIARAPRDRKKQKVYLPLEPGVGNKREAVTEYKVLERFKGYTLLEVSLKTGRKHQIRCHMAYIKHPIIGDNLYGFKDTPSIPGLKRQFLHAYYLKIRLPSGEIKEFRSDLPDDLKEILKKIK